MSNFTLETPPELVLLAFRPLLMPIYEALELALPKAIQIVAENGWERSGHLVSHLIRAEAKRFLKDRACPIEIDDIPRTVTMEQIAMEGLSTKFDGITVKVLKGTEIPRPTTIPREQFYQHISPDLWVSGAVPPIKGLIVLWDCTDDGANLRLQLCCTKDKRATDFWMISIPHPANWIVVPTQSTAHDDLDDMFIETVVKKASEN